MQTEATLNLAGLLWKRLFSRRLIELDSALSGNPLTETKGPESLSKVTQSRGCVVPFLCLRFEVERKKKFKPNKKPEETE